MTNVALSPLGLRLKSYRLQHGLLQARLGEPLGLSGRVISDIERGIRELSDEELKLFQQVFNTKLLDVDTSWLESKGRSAMEPQLYSEEAFIPLQQQFLDDHRLPNTELWFDYDLWFLNPRSLPLLTSDAIKTTWIDNLNSGATYNTIWLFDFTPLEDLARFVLRAREVLRHVVDKHNQPKVQVYPVNCQLAASDESNSIGVHYERWRSTEVESPGLLLHDVLSIREFKEADRVLPLLMQFMFGRGCVVGYRPRRPLAAPAAVVLALQDVAVFGEPGSVRGYCALGDESSADFMALLRFLEDGFKKMEKK